MISRPWDRAAALPATTERREPEIVALAPGTPSLETLFTFMRDAELRFETLRLRIEERTFGARGEQLVQMDVSIRHPGHARVVTTEPGQGAVASSEIWISDGITVRTYSTVHRLGTARPMRPRPRGLESRGLPGFAKVYEPLTALPLETLAELFVHPAGYCQNTLATGRCWISGSDRVAGREAIVLECDHPRAVEVEADRQDYHVQVAVDRLDGLISRVVESVRGEVTRIAEAIHLEPDAALAPATFVFEFPTGTTMLF
ncbi:MAG TPA: hypothetical protein VEX41_11665 [Candidatus Eisenbacteria bacterium]|nr:hypothetical protein [Candidatus Eisenbacteria bacterium]